jgi:hypothetical protein
MTAATSNHPSASRRSWLRGGALLLASIVLLSLGGAISLTKPFQNGTTRVFGKVVDGVKDHPRATVAVALGGVLILWMSIAAIAVIQEVKASRKAARGDL